MDENYQATNSRYFTNPKQDKQNENVTFKNFLNNNKAYRANLSIETTEEMPKENVLPTANSISDQKKHRCFQTKIEQLLLVDPYKRNLKEILQIAEKNIPGVGMVMQEERHERYQMV